MLQGLPVIDAPLAWVCEDCGDVFTLPVWHCLSCDRHWTDLRIAPCPNCHAEHPREWELA